MQKTFLMLESVLYKTLEGSFREACPKQAVTRLIGASNPRFFRSYGVSGEEGGLKTQVWNSLLSLKMENEGDKRVTCDISYGLPERRVGRRFPLFDARESAQSQVKAWREHFDGVIPSRSRLHPEDCPGGEEEALEMLFSFVEKGILDRMKNCCTSALEVIESAVATYDRRFFDFSKDSDGNYVIGNELIGITFTPNKDAKKFYAVLRYPNGFIVKTSFLSVDKFRSVNVELKNLLRPTRFAMEQEIVFEATS